MGKHEYISKPLGVFLGFLGTVSTMGYGISNWDRNPYAESVREPFESRQRIHDTLVILERDRQRLINQRMGYPEHVPLDVRAEIESLYGSDNERLSKIASLDRAVISVKRDLEGVDKNPAIISYNEWKSNNFPYNQAVLACFIMSAGFLGFALGFAGGFMLDRKLDSRNQKPSPQTTQ